ncbi:hypothetical protein FACS189419_05730 [Planctomycetales bacterium]|nr:hypothetical protein FACS189419_05730 [Planctomycetales bacterium]
MSIIFDAAFLQKLEYYTLVSRRQFRGTYLAQKRSKQHGTGVEFADHQKYVFGDDLRYLDWNVYARFGTELIKRFTEDRDLPVYLFLDCSKSMTAGNPVKFDYARQLIAALAYVALKDLDRVGIVAFAEKIHDFYPPVRGKHRTLQVLRHLESLQTAGTATDLKAVMTEFVNRNYRKGLAVIVSDFFDPAGFQSGIDVLRYRGFEPNLIQIHDILEAEPKLRGDIQLIDTETGLAENVTVNESILRQYKKRFAGFLDSLRRYSLRCGINYAISPTNVPLEELVSQTLKNY